jgi:hypothetical protein
MTLFEINNMTKLIIIFAFAAVFVLQFPCSKKTRRTKKCEFESKAKSSREV